MERVESMCKELLGIFHMGDFPNFLDTIGTKILKKIEENKVGTYRDMITLPSVLL